MTNQAENPGTARASGGPRHWHLLPTAFFVIGICSIILVVWVKQLNETERANSALVDSMMDVRDYAATTHLWMEEAIYGDPAVDVKKQLADMDQAVNILNAVLEGGQSEHGMITRPLTDPPLRAQATASLSLFREFKATALARLAHPEVSQIGSPSDQRFDDLYKDIDDSVRRLEGSLEQVRVADYTKSRRLFLGILLTWAVVVTSTTAGIWNREARKKQAEDALVRANVKLFSQAEELVEHREHLSEIVQMRTAELNLANRELTEAEQKLRHLSSRLLAAQETERKRISMELHDELGQALNTMKLHVSSIETSLGEEQAVTKEDCEALLAYIDRVIEDVRRLSRYLSPTILEDLGITAALGWLAGNFSKDPSMKFSSDIDEIDDLFPRKQWITIYRVVQEALTNVAKHSRAASVRLDIHRQDDTVVFSVLDDGTGFDPGQASAKDAARIGLGLSTMDERVRMMGGVFELASREGAGTRVSFSLPVGKGGA